VKWQQLEAAPADFVYFDRMSSFRKIDAFKKMADRVNIFYAQWLGYRPHVAPQLLHS
jgi:hypothetical protein